MKEAENSIQASRKSYFQNHALFWLAVTTSQLSLQIIR